MYRNNLVSTEEACAESPYASIVDPDGNFYGAGFYKGDSYIPVRILSLNPEQVLPKKNSGGLGLPEGDGAKQSEQLPYYIRRCRLSSGTDRGPL